MSDVQCLNKMKGVLRSGYVINYLSWDEEIIRFQVRLVNRCLIHLSCSTNIIIIQYWSVEVCNVNHAVLESGSVALRDCNGRCIKASHVPSSSKIRVITYEKQRALFEKRNRSKIHLISATVEQVQTCFYLNSLVVLWKVESVHASIEPCCWGKIQDVVCWTWVCDNEIFRSWRVQNEKISSPNSGL